MTEKQATEIREQFPNGSDRRIDIAYTRPEHIVRDYISRGLIVLDPADLGVSSSVHEQIFNLERKALKDKKRITAENVPDIMKITNAPGVVAACEKLVGPNFAIVPFTHNTPFMSGSNDQHWHKDDNGPYNLRKQRHHQPIQLEMLYYPQAVKPDMGPTATVPYSQYWTFNHEENHDNFAGADHLDFAYQISGMERIPISGPRSTYSEEDIVGQTTDHDVRMRESVLNLNWPHCQQFEVGPLKAGSVVLYSHNLLHRGNHRRDDWRTWKDNPRFMWRFWLYRTTEPQYSDVTEIDWSVIRTDKMTRQNLVELSKDVVSVWRYQNRWMQSGQSAQMRSICDDEISISELTEQLWSMDDANEPRRIGAAYRLAEHSQRSASLEVLGDALISDRESVRRAGLYGLIATGPDSSMKLLSAVESRARWVRKAAVFGLGSAGMLTKEVVQAIGARLLDDPSVFVRSVAADAMGCFARRAVANPESRYLVNRCAELLVASLSVEVNRLSMDRAQGRNIKMVRPTDECDVCEGIGFDYGQERYEPVRSAVRENVLWAIVILSSHGADVLDESLSCVVDSMAKVISEDENVFCVGLAMDVMVRLARVQSTRSGRSKQVESQLNSLFARTPIYSLEALVASGMGLEEAVSKYAHRPLS